jgi:hypothetical protein
MCVRARYVRATTNAARARVSPLPTFQGGKEKNRFDVSIERTRAPAAFSRLVLSGSARECQVGTPNPQSGVNFFFSSPTLGGETETHTNATEKTKKGAANLPLLPVGVNRLGRYFEKRRTTARASGHSSRRANGGFRTAKRAARGFASLGGGSTREKVRISVASARTPRAPSRNRRFRRCSFFLLSRRPAFRGNRHPATRPGGGRDEGSETRSVARDSDARALTDHTPALTLTAPTHRDEAARPWTERART